ncbi:BAI1-associated protein 3 [Monodelphis domestica]|uniref:BAI1-associated protein 3 n=1 Tax=Monodelphis domestica TaxID=13616 RepID=UPI0024E24C87|nr:BAI1-associated protein 3 [Monodelphis domestica]XP_056661639.1 BAI1-associated protein 3 [Monodelphis domestica]XP_056661640.1 BAI1-associated protein 3 [Monodelphis domestica]
MSTLLDIKSSVLRQVQRSQSFRRRADEAVASGAAAGPSSSLPEGGPDTGVAREEGDDGDFFSKMKLILKKKESRQRLGRLEGVLHSSAPPPREPLGLGHAAESLMPTKKEMEMLFEEALYTVCYRSGVASPDHVVNEDELFDYLQKVFGMSSSELEAALHRVKEAKPPSYSLKVTVVRAKNLLAKDANGFSDPYCMLGILIGQSPRELGEKKERKFSFRKRKEKGEKRNSAREVLPAKYIQVTEVKNSTLNPVWNEHFLFEIDDATNDQLHLDIWDHDDDVSVAEACKKLNEVIGFKGMGRYFKQIVKSARANGTAGASEDNADDFLGCLNIPIREIPVAGLDKWFKLEPRSSSSRVQGDCHLILKLITTQRDTNMSRRMSGFQVHGLLLSQLLKFEHGQEQPEAYSWKGELSGPAVTILCHHGTQTDLSALQLAMIHWQASSQHHQAWSLDYGYLLELLGTIQEQWGEAAAQLPREQEESLANSFISFVEHALLLLRQLRELFPVTNSNAISRLEFLLRCLSQIHSLQPFRMVCPFQNELHVDIATALKKGTQDWYERLQRSRSPLGKPGLECLPGLISLADAVYDDLQASHSVYGKLFVSIVKVDLFGITYRQLEKMVAEEVQAPVEELSAGLESGSAPGLFELYITLAEIQRLRVYLPTKDSPALALPGFHTQFLPAIRLWLQTLRDKMRQRLQRAVEVDKLEPVDPTSKHSSSAADAALCFSQTQELWAQLAWPESAEALDLVTQLTEDICEAALHYPELLRKKVDTRPLALGEAVSEPLCIALNNVEHVRKATGQVLRSLEWPEPGGGSPGGLPRALKNRLLAMDEDLQREARNMIAHLTAKMVGDIKKYVQHISLSPDSIQNEEAIAPLMKYLDDKLILLSDSLVKENLCRVLEALWDLLLQVILQALGANRDVSAEFYRRFYYTLEALVEFFHAEGQGLPLESLRDGHYKTLEEELRLNKCSTNECIEQYYLDKLKQGGGTTLSQRSMEQNKYGRLSVRCYYEAAEQRLAVEVLHAADLIALDANGLSDPFVIVELCPHHVFPLARSQRTQVKAKTLHPVYDELFHFSVPAELCRHRAACVVFTVMDHDWLSTNDFAGEAALALSSISGLSRPQVGSSVRSMQPTTLHLRRPKANVKSALRMLEGRMDREAQEFVKKLKEMEKSMGDD